MVTLTTVGFQSEKWGKGYEEAWISMLSESQETSRWGKAEKHQTPITSSCNLTTPGGIPRQPELTGES